MTNEEKQALIEDCQRDILDLERDIARCDAIGTVDYLLHLQSRLKRQQIALAALTAQPVKLPDYTPEVYPNSALENQKIKSRNEAISDCADAIRAAGYEVQE